MRTRAVGLSVGVLETVSLRVSKWEMLVALDKAVSIGEEGWPRSTKKCFHLQTLGLEILILAAKAAKTKELKGMDLLA